MKNQKTPDKTEVLRLLPSIDALLHTETTRKLLPECGVKHLALLARNATDLLRREIQEKISNDAINEEDYSRENLLKQAEENLETLRQNEKKTSLQKVINATGVVIHTNLGYENAIGENTRLILRVHPSNYRIVGFTASPPLAKLAELAHRNDILLYEDAGSGAIFDLSRYGLSDEPIINQSIAAGADVVTFSGDKLLGGAQSGLIVGKSETIEKLRKHPLYRALRVDKLIYAALEATLEAFGRESTLSEIPVLRMLSLTNDEIKQRAFAFSEKLSEKLGKNSALQIEITNGTSVIGGGSAPLVQPATMLLVLRHEKMSASELEKTLRLSKPPVIARILEDKVLIDLRTISETEEAELFEVLASIF
ncbi:MAG: L-seryl-tRNA(Sec) selenium transferase [Acidobacteria bacterium]|nr:L-seryl-tRNA(Sec) selenium transferase [Acidobacteriota bacterium]